MCRHLTSHEIIAHRVSFHYRAVFLMTYSCCGCPSVHAWLPSMTTASLLVAARKKQRSSGTVAVGPLRGGLEILQGEVLVE